MSVIYQPKGRALEYCENALNIYLCCDHGCTYCYVPNIIKRTRQDFSCKNSVRSHLIERIKKEVHLYSGKEVLLSFACDPYSHFDVIIEMTRKVIKVLLENNVKIVILSKGGKRSLRDMKILEEHSENVKFGATLTFIDKNDSRIYEPGAADPMDRLNALSYAKQRGLKTWVSLEPVIDPFQTLTLIDRSVYFVDEYRVGKLNYDPLSKKINWNKFLEEIEKKFNNLQKAYQFEYYIKKDLEKFRSS